MRLSDCFVSYFCMWHMLMLQAPCSPVISCSCAPFLPEFSRERCQRLLLLLLLLLVSQRRQCIAPAVLGHS